MGADKCPQCGRPPLANAVYCHHCGATIAPATPAAAPDPAPAPRPTVDAQGRIACVRCKTVNRPAALHCRTCGTALVQATIARPGELVTPKGERIGVLAGFWVRLAAYAVDSVLLALVVALFAPFLGNGSTAVQDLSPAEYVAYALGFLYAVVGWSAFGTTLGKRLFRLYVVRPDGSVPSAARALLRQLATFLSILTLCFGYIMIGMRPDKRGLHDLMSDTYVVIKA
jgi:uncharacterized RDD family membrane protein YckC